jgi:hypothetical protein
MFYRNPPIIRILSLTYGTNGIPQVCQTFQQTLDPTFEYYDTLLCKDYAVMCRKSTNSTNVTLDIVDMSTGRMTSMETILPFVSLGALNLKTLILRICYPDTVFNHRLSF